VSGLYSLADAEARISKALGLIDTWLADESPHDGMQRRYMWKCVREIRAALDRCPHVDLRRESSSGEFDAERWDCEDCGYSMTVNVKLTDDEARERMDRGSDDRR
jgi:hypothetical protein